MIPVKSLDWPDTAPERALTLPARYFYDEDIFKAERERIFYPAWWDPLESTCRHASLSIL